jgi:hypothetical protein
MTTDRDRLTAFFTALIQGRAYKMVPGAINELHLYDTPTMTDAAKDVAREMVDRLLGSEPAESPTMDPGWPAPDVELYAKRFWGVVAGGLGLSQWPPPNEAWAKAVREAIAGMLSAAPDNDRRRRETLLAAAALLTKIRGMLMARHADVDAMIDRCNLDAVADGGVVRSEPDVESLLLTHVGAGASALFSTGATAAEVERLRRFEAGVTALLGEPVVGTDGMLERLRERLSAPTVVQHYHFSTGGGCDIAVHASADSVLVNGETPRLVTEAKP